MIEDLSLTVDCLREKDSEGYYANLMLAIEDVSTTLKSPEMAQLIVSTTLISCVMGTGLAYKKTFWTNHFNDTQEQLENWGKSQKDSPPKSFGEHVAENFVSDASRAFTKAHKDAPYKKYMTYTALGSNALVILGTCGATITARRKKEQESDDTHTLG